MHTGSVQQNPAPLARCRKQRNTRMYGDLCLNAPPRMSGTCRRSVRLLGPLCQLGRRPAQDHYGAGGAAAPRRHPQREQAGDPGGRRRHVRGAHRGQVSGDRGWTPAHELSSGMALLATTGTLMVFRFLLSPPASCRQLAVTHCGPSVTVRYTLFRLS